MPYGKRPKINGTRTAKSKKRTVRKKTKYKKSKKY
tara:strand:- start:1591 stop:1695 length:105 start_codon:yes stop_codon:yes gene_type:complete